MTRCLFHIASAVSLLLCVATLLLWVRSYSRQDEIQYTSATAVEKVVTIGGTLWFERRT